MKLKALMLALFVAGLTASFALADNGGHGKGKPEGKTGTATTAVVKSKDAAAKTCRPRIELQLSGTVASSSGDSLAVLVGKGGPQGAQLKGKQLTLDVSKAKVKGTAASGAPVKVHARACVDLVAGTVTLVASNVNYGKGGGDDEEDGTTSSTTTTTESTTTTTGG